ncbi:MAG: alpha-N-arabinofuranosidase [Armatimonadetes bacterium]|nr:alpha-N-arabinofuranosidase [Armatimonadota bacterium]
MPVVHLRPNDTYARIDPNLYGHFAEHLGTCIYEGLWVGEDSAIPNTQGIRNDVLDALRRLKPPVIRWPGGCFADTYHWADGVGPRATRPRRVNVWWGQAIDDNAFGTHEFLTLCRLLGANFTGDSSRARLRRAHGSEAPFNVTYWGVGNENWGCGGQLDPEDYAVEYRRFSTYLHEFSGHPLYLIACGPSGNNPDWSRRFLGKTVGRCRVHGFAAHYYCGTVGTATQYDDAGFLTLIWRALVQMELLIVQQRATLDSFDPERRIGLIVDEWGTWHPVEEGHPGSGLWQQNTMRDALVAAGTLDIFNRHADEVVMGNIAQMVNVLQAMCLTDGERMLCTPTYHVYAMYAAHQGARAVPVSFECEKLSFVSDDRKPHQIDAVAGSASVRGKELTMTVTHHDPQHAAELTLRLHGAAAAGAEASVLAGADIRSHNTFEAPDAVRPQPLAAHVEGGAVTLLLPPASVACVRVALA